MPRSSIKTKDLLLQLDHLLNIGIALSAEKDPNLLLQMIVTEARRITNADAGTLYLCKPNGLKFKIMQNDTLNISQGGDKEINLPPVPYNMDNVSAYVSITGQSVNIPDVYRADGFDFSGPREYDQMTNYLTRSMLVVPMQNHESTIIGVLQLINALDQDRNIIPFTPADQKVVESLASQAAIALTKELLLQEIEQFFNSFVEVMATAIDALTPYNANHTRRVVRYSEAVARFINDTQDGPYCDVFFDQERMDQLLMAAWLHDIGKIATPLNLMNKATRLDSEMTMVLQRFEYLKACLEVRALRKQNELMARGDTAGLKNEEIEFQSRLAELEGIRSLVLQADDPATVVDKKLAQEIKRIGEITFYNLEGEARSVLTPKEIEKLCIPTGTLTSGEREVVEDHVMITLRLLEKVPFIKKYKNVPQMASSHHERLDGQGYPYRLKGEQISLESRILAITDIFDALTSKDRPYKKVVPVEAALKILEAMVKEGKLDSDLLEVLKKSRAWEEIKEI